MKSLRASRLSNKSDQKEETFNNREEVGSACDEATGRPNQPPQQLPSLSESLAVENGLPPTAAGRRSSSSDNLEPEMRKAMSEGPPRSKLPDSKITIEENNQSVQNIDQLQQRHRHSTVTIANSGT